MVAYIDRRLTRNIDRAAASGQIDAIIVVKDAADPALSLDGILLHQVIEAAIERAGDIPAALRYYPRANAAVISASRKLIEEVLQDDNVAVASAVDIDLMVFY